MSSSDQSRWWTATEVTLGLSAFVAPWCLGGAPPWTSSVLLALAAVAVGTWAIGAIRAGRRGVWHPALAVSLAVVAIEAVQLVPLPATVLGALSPPAAELREFALVPIGLDGWRPVTLDAPLTARALARGIALLGFLFAALQLSRLAGPRRRLFAVMAVAGLSVVVCGFGHLLANEDALFGVHRFQGNTPLITPFGNTNHLAAFLTLTATLALGLALDSASRDSRLGWSLAALAMGVGVFLSLSRGGIGAFLVTWGTVAATLFARRAGGARGAVPWIVIGATTTVAGVLAFEQLVERWRSVDSLSKLTTTKVELWPAFARAGVSHWPAGMGAGTFELGFTRFQLAQLHETFTHPENGALQWFTELGAVATIGLLVLVGFAFVALWRETRERQLERVALLGAVGVVIHDVFDFALELNAVSVLFVMTLALCARREQGRSFAVGWRVFAAAGLALAVAVGALAWGRATHGDAERELTAEIVRPGATSDSVQGVARPLLALHPADFVLYANVANFMAARGSPQQALAWVNRLLLLRPRDATAHVAAARALLRLGSRAQAMLEYRLSFELGDRSALALALAIASKEGDFERLFIEQPGFLTECFAVLEKRHDSSSRALVARARLEDGVIGAEARVLEVQLAAREKSPAEALALLDALPQADRERRELIILRARLQARLGEDAQALAQLNSQLTSHPSDIEVAWALCDLLEERRRFGESRAVLTRLRPFVNGAQQLDVVLREAATWEAEERWAKAIEVVQSAARLAPARPDLQYRLGQLFERTGATQSAADAVRRGRSLDTVEGARAVEAWLERLERAARALPEVPPR